MTWEIMINTDPVAKGRPRLGRRGTYTPKKTVNFENLIKSEWIVKNGRTAIDGSLTVELCFYRRPPKGTSRKNLMEMLNGNIKPTTRPDLDNYIKAVLDALNGVAYKDDSAITVIKAEKRYSEHAAVCISISNMEG